MATRQKRLDDFDSNGEPPAGELMELLCEDHNGTYVLPFPVVGLMERGAPSGPTVRLKPTSLAGEGSDCAALRSAKTAGAIGDSVT
jgi:hypothetical protein